MKGWDWYRTATMGVFPYMPGVSVYRDGMLPYLYNRLKDERKVGLTFCGEEKTQDDFVSYFNRIKTLQVLCSIGDPVDPEYPNGEKTITPVGFSWVDNPRGIDGQRAAMPGEAFFKGSERVARGLAKLALGYVMHDMKVDVFHGVQVVSNFAARNFAIRCGFREVAVIPKYHLVNGKLEDARIMILEAKEYLPKFFAWKEAIDLKEKSEKPVEALA